MDLITTEAIEFSLLFTSLIFSIVTLLVAGKTNLARLTNMHEEPEDQKELVRFDYYIIHILTFIVIALVVVLRLSKVGIGLSILVFGASAINLIIASVQVKKSEEEDSLLKQPLAITLIEMFHALLIIGYTVNGLDVF